ncbi:DUF998 domain-containing protein [Lacinutrix sp.]|uniref:DUF998 domain-containing protein n=1 Tax=Lacinutrix sp. TaxID=1937692 RepID=UPI0025C34826|nr:DUF998 domain-containing protein [Lacinutrix sp.]
MNKTAVFWFGIIGSILFIIPSILGGLQFENYNHIQQFISEGFAIDTPYGTYLRFLGYIPSGILIAAFSFSAIQTLPKSNLAKIGLILFGVFYGIGNIIVAVFPCDSGCNKELIDPTISQIIHNTSGTLTYLIVPISLILIGLGIKKWKNGKSISLISFVCASIAILFSILLSGNPNGNYIGLFQRLIESSILFWLINFAFYLKNTTTLKNSYRNS